MVSILQEFAPSTLDNILSPMGSDEFISQYFGKSLLHVPGPNDKFSSVLPWDELNRILEEHEPTPQRIRLVQAGKVIPTEKYLSVSDRNGPRLKAADLTTLLAQGATLILNNVDEVCVPVRKLAVGLGRIFRTDVWVNMYAGWRTDQGFLLHYDDHDTVILQIAGRKHWKVYRPTRLYPLEPGKDAERAPKPVEEPIWDKIIEAGGLLYIPRGWWHVAYPVDDPTLHLTLGLLNRRGLHLLHWLANQLKNCLEVRQDIPHLADRATQQAYMSALREHLFSAWSEDLLDRFLTSSDAHALSRPHFQLPEAATPEGIAVRRKSRVKLTGPRRLDFSVKPLNGGFTVQYADRTFYGSESILPSLKHLNDGEDHNIEELIALAPDQAANLINFLQGLVLQGVLTTVPQNADHSP
jgi:ribosomal protein L16 Arg81 hydroxylase